MDDAAKIARDCYAFEPMKAGEYHRIVQVKYEGQAEGELAARIRAYGEQCRRAGAAAMREAAEASLVASGPTDDSVWSLFGAVALRQARDAISMLEAAPVPAPSEEGLAVPNSNNQESKK